MAGTGCRSLRLLIGAILLAFAWAVPRAGAQTAMLLEDINPGSAGMVFEFDVTFLNGKLLFDADRAGEGVELWKTNGTAAGTVLVKDIWDASPTASSGPRRLEKIGNTVFFAATDADGGELWKTDGTASGTVQVKDIDPGSGFSEPRNLFGFGNQVLFSADDGVTGRELWISDGTSGGTTLVEDITVGDSHPRGFHQVGSVVYFIANDPAGSPQLWRTDGTSSGTALVAAIDASGSSDPTDDEFSPVLLAGGLVYWARDIANGCQLWRTDVATHATSILKVFNGNLGTDNLDCDLEATVIGTTMFFAADDGSNGCELWEKSDGTTAGTVLVRDIQSGADSGLEAPGSCELDEGIELDGTLYFAADDGSSGRELWRSDGTFAGTTRVKDIHAGSGNSMGGPFGNDVRFTRLGAKIYFAADDGSSGQELWGSDGTEAGTQRVKDIRPGATGSGPAGLENFGPLNLVAAGGLLFMAANDGSSGAELWRSDGTEAGTFRVADIDPGGDGLLLDDEEVLLCEGEAFCRFGNRLLFVADDGTHGAELWFVQLETPVPSLSAPALVALCLALCLVAASVQRRPAGHDAPRR